MRKGTDKLNPSDTILDMLSKINVGIHTDLGELEELVEKYELDGYFDSENLPDVKKIDQSDISVEQVCIIGMAATMRNIHEQFHEVIDKAAKELGVDMPDHDGKNKKKTSAEKELEGLFGGKIVVAGSDNLPKDIPPEVREIIEALTEVIKKNRKKNSGDKSNGKK